MNGTLRKPHLIYHPEDPERRRLVDELIQMVMAMPEPQQLVILRTMRVCKACGRWVRDTIAAAYDEGMATLVEVVKDLTENPPPEPLKPA